ncbi:MAG: hypothetical protein CMJ82_14850 [Planctomycetaceae bacterium]|nr:hypothetical protein [Planctomycetaceae bacterium]
MNAERPGAVSERLQQAVWLSVILVLSVSLYASFAQPPAVATDVGTYLLANATNPSRNPTILSSVDPKDLTLNRHQNLTWWPESYGSIPEFVNQSATTLGINLNTGQTIQCTTLIGWLAGVSLWFWFFKLVCPPRALPWIFLCLLTARYSHANFYLYDGGEFLYWAIFPAVLLLNYKAVTADQTKIYSAYLAAGAGALTPMLVLLKYSAGLSSVGFGMAWLWLLYKNRISKRSFVNWSVNAGTIAFFIFWLGLIPEGNPTQVDSAGQWTPLLWITGAWLFAMTDLGTLLNKFTVDILPDMGNHHDASEGWLFLPLALLLWWVLKQYLSARPDKILTDAKTRNGRILLVGHLIGFSLILLVFLMSGSAIHMDTRFLRPAAIAVLPLTLLTLWNARSSSRGLVRIAASVLLVSLTLIPSLYGMAALVHKSFVRAEYAEALTDPVGLRHDLLSLEGNGVRFFQELENMTTADDVIYILEPSMGIPLNNRRLLVEEHAHLRSKDDLATRTYQGTPNGKLYLPLPKLLVTDGRAEVIKESFRDISQWNQRQIPNQPDWLLLIGQ